MQFPSLEKTLVTVHDVAAVNARKRWPVVQFNLKTVSQLRSFLAWLLKLLLRGTIGITWFLAECKSH